MDQQTTVRATDTRYVATSEEDSDSESGSYFYVRSADEQHQTRLPSLQRMLDIFVTAIVIFLLNTVIASWPAGIQQELTTASKPESSNPIIYGGLTVEHDEYGAYVECPHDDIEAALAANCSLDLLANGWTPSPCFDAEMNHHFVDGLDFAFSFSSDGGHRISQQTISEGNLSDVTGGLWVSWDEHLHHCRCLVNGSIRAMADHSKGLLDIWLDGKHMRHCLGVLGEEHAADEIDTMVKAVFWYRRCYLRHHLTKKGMNY